MIRAQVYLHHSQRKLCSYLQFEKESEDELTDDCSVLLDELR